jgi:hypothetical protein
MTGMRPMKMIGI